MICGLAREAKRMFENKLSPGIGAGYLDLCAPAGRPSARRSGQNNVHLGRNVVHAGQILSSVTGGAIL